MPRIRVSISLHPASRTPRSGDNSNGSGGRPPRVASTAPGGIVLASASSDPSQRRTPIKKQAWEELDDLEYQGGDEYKSSKESMIDDLPIQRNKRSDEAMSERSGGWEERKLQSEVNVVPIKS